MGNEFKEMMEEVYKFLRDKIISRLGENLSELQKEKLFSFDIDAQISINNTNKIIEYDFETDTINISDGFLNTENVNKIKLKYSDFDIEVLKTKIEEGSPYILTEELIYFNEELKIKERDIIKSLYLQEILKMILLKNISNIKEQIIIEGFIELISHEIGVVNGFIVSSYSRMKEELEIALKLKEELGKKFESTIMQNQISSVLENLENKKLIKLLNENTDDRTVIESTQNLDEVVESINEVVEEVSQVSVINIKGKNIVKFVDENEELTLYETLDNEKFMELYHGLKKQKSEGEKVLKKELENAIDEYKKGTPFYKIYNPEAQEIELSHLEENIDTQKINVNLPENSFVKEAIVKIDSNETNSLEENKSEEKMIEEDKPKVSAQEYENIIGKFDNDSNSLTMDELDKANDFIASKEIDKKVSIKSAGKRKIILSIVGVIVIVGLGILIGWLLFNLK